MYQITTEHVNKFRDEIKNNSYYYCIERFSKEFIQKHSVKSTYDQISLKELLSYMFYVWRSYIWKDGNFDINFCENTLPHWVYYIFNFTQVERDIKYFSPLIKNSDIKILDTGSCWGSLTIALLQKSKNIYSIDYVPGHATVTKLRNPQINSFCGDVRNMGFGKKFFNLIISRGVIEHVGDSSSPRGRVSNANYTEKLKYLKSCHRILADDGYLWLATGNFLSIYNGETNEFFSHWLDQFHYNEYLGQAKVVHDKYWLLTWEQMESLAHDAGFEIVDVSCPDACSILRLRENLKTLGTNPLIIDLLSSQAQYDPNLMDSWFVTMRKSRLGISRDKASYVAMAKVIRKRMLPR